MWVAPRSCPVLVTFQNHCALLEVVSMTRSSSTILRRVISDYNFATCASPSRSCQFRTLATTYCFLNTTGHLEKNPM
jgi:hypothetical protein